MGLFLLSCSFFYDRFCIVLMGLFLLSLRNYLPGRSLVGSESGSTKLNLSYFPDSNPTNACSQVHGSKRLGCHTGHHEVSRSHTRGESEDSVAHKQMDSPLEEFTKSPKQGYQWPPQEGLMSSKIFFKKS